MKPYYDHKGITIYHGDCLEILPELEPVDLVLTSPPYNLGNFKKGSFYAGKKKGKNLTYLSHSDDMKESDYINWQHNCLRAFFSALIDMGAIFYNHKPRVEKGIFNDRKNLIPFPIRQEIIWDRGGMINFSGSFYAPNTERIFIIAKPKWKPIKECLGFGEVWRISPKENNLHPAPFPVELAKKVISSNNGETILDPFMGSGTTLVAAKELGRKAIGIEIEEKYCEIAVRRLAQEMLPFGSNQSLETDGYKDCHRSA